MKDARPLSGRILRVCWGLFALLIILAAIALSVVRMLLPLAQDYRQEVERLVSNEFGREVTIGSLALEWKGLYPLLKVRDVSLSMPGATARGQQWLHFDELGISFRMVPLLTSATLELNALQITGTELVVVREPDGGYLLNGVRIGGAKGETGSRGEVLGWVFARARLGLLDSSIIFHDREAARTLRLQGVGFTLSNEGSLHRFNGRFSLDDRRQSRVAFVLNLSGDMAVPEKLSAEFYLEGGVDLASWSGTGLAQLQQLQGSATLHLWGGMTGSELQRLEGDVRLQGLRWPGVARGDAQPNPLVIENLSGDFAWRRVLQGGWALDVENYQMESGGGEITSPSRFTLAQMPDPREGEPVWYGRFDHLRMQHLVALVQSVLPSSSPVLSVPALSTFGGEMHDVLFRYYGSEWHPEYLYLKGGVDGLQFSASGGVPSLSGVDVQLEMNGRRGHAMLSSTQRVSADFHGLFAEQLHIDTLSGRLDWEMTAAGWQISGEDLRVANADLNTRGRLLMRYAEGMSSPFLDMQLGFDHGDVANAYKYLPRRIMGPRVVQWLDRALTAGQLGSGGMLFRGPLDGFPFDKGEGVFEVRFNVENTILSYMEGWPRAEEVAADVVFSGRSLAVKIVAGKIFGLDIEPATVEMVNLTHQPELDLKLQAQGPVADMLRYLRVIPAGAGYREFLSGVTGEGAARFDMQLLLPIHDTKHYRLSGNVHFEQNRLHLEQWDTGLSQVSGPLYFDLAEGRSDFNAREISAQFEGHKATISVYPLAGMQGGTGTAGSETYIDISTRLDATGLINRYAPFLAGYMQGVADGVISVRISPAAKPGRHDVTLHIESLLQGIEVSLPGEFAHPAAAQSRLLLDILVSAGERLPVHVDYGGRVKAVLELRKLDAAGNLALGKGAVSIGGAEPVMPEAEHIELLGKLARLDVAQWRQWYEEVSRRQTPVKKRLQAGAGGLLGKVGLVNLEMDALQVAGQSLHEVKVSVVHRGAYLDAMLKSREIAGAIRVPENLEGDDPLVLDLDYLTLSTEGEAANGKDEVDPQSWPPLKISSRKFVFNGVDYGQLTLSSRRVKQGIRFEQLDMKSDLLQLVSNGSWLRSAKGHLSDFNIKLTSPDLGRLLKQWGYSVAIRGGKTTASINAKWADSPERFDMGKLEGELALTIRDGQLLDVEPAGGRVFGLLSIQALPRRLALDFSDIFRKGFGFDRIEGKFAITEGNAYTNDLYLEGPAARIDISGRVGLTERDYDQDMYVTSHISSTLPVVGGLAGGPGVGLGLLLAERLFKGQLDRISRIQYEVKGSWDKPEVTRVGKSAR